jgi:hypothetical protein
MLLPVSNPEMMSAMAPGPASLVVAAGDGPAG